MKGSWLRNLLYEEDSESLKKKEEKAEKTEIQQPVDGEGQKGVVTSGGTSGSQANQVTAPKEGSLDQNLLNKLCDVLDENSEEGIDYLKYKRSVDSLKTFQPDEDMRFTTAYISLKATNSTLTKEYLLQTIDKYLNVIEQERKVGLEKTAEAVTAKTAMLLQF